MDVKKETAGSCLDILISSFNARIVELQELVIARNSNFAIFFFLSFFHSITIYMSLILTISFQCIRPRPSLIYPLLTRL